MLTNILLIAVVSRPPFSQRSRCCSTRGVWHSNPLCRNCRYAPACIRCQWSEHFSRVRRQRIYRVAFNHPFFFARVRFVLTSNASALKRRILEQTTFVKAVFDPHALVRQRGSSALQLLMPLSTRVDPLVNELLTGTTASAESPADSLPIQITMLETLGHVFISPAAAKVRVLNVLLHAASQPHARLCDVADLSCARGASWCEDG